MAAYKIRGNAHHIIYPFKTEAGETKQQWETDQTELEAVQRKAYIDYLQQKNFVGEIRKAALEHRKKSARKKRWRKNFYRMKSVFLALPHQTRRIIRKRLMECLQTNCLWLSQFS